MTIPNYKIIRAQYKGYCSVCGQGIEPGQKIKYAKGHPTLHETCESPTIPADAIHLEGGSGSSCSGWTPKIVIKNPNRRNGSSRDRSRRTQRWSASDWQTQNPGPVDTTIRFAHARACGAVLPEVGGFSELWAWEASDARGQEWRAIYDEADKEWRARRDAADPHLSLPDDDGPEFLYVLTASARFIREDGLSFNVGDESGYVYSATCRPATDEESAPLRQEIAAAQAKREAADKLKEIRKQVINHGEWPEPTDGQISPNGETVPFGPGQNIYGGGAWFVVGPEWIWYVINNGADGDDWSSNNVRTGGAGAIGRRVPATPELSEQIKSLATAAGFTE